MKYYSTLFLSLLLSCGDGLVDHSTDKTTFAVASDAELILDAKNLKGDSAPSGECDETNWNDSSGNNKDGTLDCATGGGRAGSGTPNDPHRVVFNGSSTSVTTTLDANAGTLPQSTWVVWLRPRRSTLSHILSMDDHAGAQNRSLVTDGSYEVFNPANNSWDTNLSVSQNKWQFVAVTFKSSKLTATKNSETKTLNTPPAYVDTAQTLTIGRSAGGAFDFFRGDIAWLAVYPRVLTQKELKETCLALRTRFANASCD